MKSFHSTFLIPRRGPRTRKSPLATSIRNNRRSSLLFRYDRPAVAGKFRLVRCTVVLGFAYYRARKTIGQSVFVKTLNAISTPAKISGWGPCEQVRVSAIRCGKLFTASMIQSGLAIPRFGRLRPFGTVSRPPPLQVCTEKSALTLCAAMRGCARCSAR